MKNILGRNKQQQVIKVVRMHIIIALCSFLSLRMSNHAFNLIFFVVFIFFIISFLQQQQFNIEKVKFYHRCLTFFRLCVLSSILFKQKRRNYTISVAMSRLNNDVCDSTCFYILYFFYKFAVVVTGQYHKMQKFIMDAFNHHLVCNI